MPALLRIAVTKRSFAFSDQWGLTGDSLDQRKMRAVKDPISLTLETRAVYHVFISVIIFMEA